MAASPCFCEATQARVPSGDIVPLWTWGTAISPTTLSEAVSMISERTHAVLATIPVGSQPRDVAVDARTHEAALDEVQ